MKMPKLHLPCLLLLFLFESCRLTNGFARQSSCHSVGTVVGCHEKPKTRRAPPARCHASPSCFSSSSLLASLPDPRVAPEGDGATTTASSRRPISSLLYRDVRHLHKYARLPVWPAWNGVFIWMIGKLLGFERAAQLENIMTGRVCPNFFQETDDTSPFLMLVHHCHTFAPIDPLRAFQRLFFPEGFPAHPHRGFVTLTYFLEGGFRHRDSLGIEQVYGQHLKGVEHHSQWLSTGAGLLHEEMFYQNAWWNWQRQELYQLWINLPSQDKMSQPYLLLLGDDKETPVMRNNNGTICRVLAGQFDQHHQAKVPSASDLAVMHVMVEAGREWSYTVPESYETLIVYMRKGSVTVKGNNENNDNTGDSNVKIPAHYTAFFESSGTILKIVADEEQDADFMVLAGVPLREPVSAQGSMVMNYPDEINKAYRDYQLGLFGRPWPHTLTREEWMAHVKQSPSAYSAFDAQEDKVIAATTTAPPSSSSRSKESSK